jgi:hypothetical protein
VETFTIFTLSSNDAKRLRPTSADQVDPCLQPRNPVTTFAGRPIG